MQNKGHSNNKHRKTSAWCVGTNQFYRCAVSPKAMVNQEIIAVSASSEVKYPDILSAFNTGR